MSGLVNKKIIKIESLVLCLLAGGAHAAEPPKTNELQLKYLNYQDSQPGWNRIHVSAPSFELTVPVNNYSITVDGVFDTVSGASPRFHTSTSSATLVKSDGTGGMHDERREGGISITRYFERGTIGLGLNKSVEHDYDSNALSLSASKSSEDNNTTLNFGYGYTYDKINPVNGVVSNAQKKTSAIMLGLTQNLTPTDLVQFNYSYSSGTGYYNDPYKMFDVRPNLKKQHTFLSRWNHYSKFLDVANHFSHRYYVDSYGVNSHTFSYEAVKEIQQIKITPGIRYYTQNSANFYVDPMYDNKGEVFPSIDPSLYPFISGDQRLAAFGAFNISLKVDVSITKALSFNVKAERYLQDSKYKIGGGSPGLQPFYANIFQLGVDYRF